MIVILSSCCKIDEEPVKHKSSCNSGYILNNDSTDCICPEATHYELFGQFGEYKVSSCYEKKKFSYLFQFEGKDCFRNRNIRNGNIGYFDFSEKYNIINIEFPSGPTIVHQDFFDVNITTRNDGKVEFDFKIWGYGDMGCTGWDSPCPSGIKGYAHGVSNDDNTDVRIRVEYKDCKNTLLDTAVMHLWKK